MKPLSPLLFVVTFALLSLVSRAQESNRSDRSLEEMSVGLTRDFLHNPAAYVESMHPESLKQFQTLILDYLRVNPPDTIATVVPILFDDDLNEQSIFDATEKEFYLSFLNRLRKTIPKPTLDLVAKADITVVGTVTEGEVVHVVVRVSEKESRIRKLEIMSFKKFEGKWRVMIGEEMEGSVRALTSQMK